MKLSNCIDRATYSICTVNTWIDIVIITYKTKMKKK